MLGQKELSYKNVYVKWSHHKPDGKEKCLRARICLNTVPHILIQYHKSEGKGKTFIYREMWNSITLLYFFFFFFFVFLGEKFISN